MHPPPHRVVNQLLTEMDGVESRAGIYLVAATNRPDMIDPALLRPGRLDKILYIPLPTAAGRVSILQALTRATPLGPDVDLDAIGRAGNVDGFSGADLAALVREAAVAALKVWGVGFYFLFFVLGGNCSFRIFTTWWGLM